MKTSRQALILFFSLIVIGCFIGCASPSEAKSTGDKSAQAAVPTLEIGMSGEAIEAQLGPPLEVKPMTPPEEFTEIWIYRLEGPMRSTQVITGTKSVPGFTMPGFSADQAQMRLVDEPVYSLSEQRTTVTLQLLVFKGHLAAHKRSIERTHNYK